MANDIAREYKPAGPTLKRFHESSAFVRGIMGPFGSGKSSACTMEILLRAHQQKPGSDGIRRSRWAVIRGTYPELKSTTLKTWSQWCPLHYGKLNQDSPIIHRIQTSGLDMEVIFLALDKDEDVKKLLSLELTGAWVNEAREIPKGILDALTGRVGRYPARMEGGPTWSGIILDTNPPTDQSFWYRYAEQETPQGWQFFAQPPGDSPEAENLQNLPKNYYQQMMAGKDPDWIKVYVRGQYGYVVEGKPVFPAYLDSSHCSTEVEPVKDVALFVGVDFGVSSAAVIGQKLPDGRWLILDEFIQDGGGVQQFAKLLTSFLALKYPDHQVGGAWGDPAGSARSLGDGQTPLAILNASTGWRWRAAPTNDIDMRLEVVAAALNRMVHGKPAFMISPRCQTLRKGFTNGYHYRLKRDGNGATVYEVPAKNQFSHPHDALQYLLLGGGESAVVLNRERTKRREVRIAGGVGDDYSPFDR